MSCAVIRSDSESAGLAVDPAGFTNPAAVAVAVSVSRLVSNLVDVLLSLILLTSAVLHSLDLGSSAYLLLAYISYFPGSFFHGEIALLFLTCLAVLRILYRPVEKQVRLRISM